MRRTALALAVSLPLSLTLIAGSAAGTASLESSATGGVISGVAGSFTPPGNLYDNGDNNGTTSLASQNSSSTFTARSADDFIITQSCASGLFNISRVRIQIVQRDTAPQAFAVDLFNDNGSNTAPTAGINPIATLAQTSQTNLGTFGAGTSMFEASFDTPGLSLSGNTRYWISGYGADAAANPSGFNNFFAASNGAVGTTANGVVIAPDAGVAAWTAAELVLGPPALAFSFAIDGTCAVLDADLSITLASAPAQVAPGGTVTFTAVATNNGPAEANDVAISVTPPAGAVLGTPTASAGGTCAGTSPVVCTWAGVTAVAGTRTATVPVTAPASVGSLSATATVSSATSDPVSANNSATAASTISIPPPAFIPTASHYGLGLLALLLGTLGFVAVRRRA